MTSAEALLYVSRMTGPGRPATPDEWGRWAAALYATEVGSAAVPHQTPEPVRDAARRVSLRRRKETALALAQLALARCTAPDGTVDTTSPWHAHVERWMATFRRIPGGIPPAGERYEARLMELACFAAAAESRR